MEQRVQHPPRLAASQLALAWRDMIESIRMYRFWMTLGWNDTKEHYRGSILGPFWLTLTTAIFIAGMGPLYATLFSLDMADYLPRMALGVSIWGFINGTITEACSTFIASAHTLRQVRLPRLVLLFRVMLKNVINFAHISPVYLGVLFYFHTPSALGVLTSFLGLIVLGLNLLWIGLLVAILCVRYRDIPPIVSSVMQICFFATPIMWDHKQLSANAVILNLNPLAAFIEIVRAPLLGESISAWSMYLSVILLFAGTALTALLFVRCRKLIVFWV